MSTRATAGASLQQLVELAIPVCQQAERQCPRTGRGRKPAVPDWVLAVMVTVAVLHRKKTKSAQHAFWWQRREPFQRWFPTCRVLSRSSFFARYRRLGPLLQEAIRLQGQEAIRRGWADATCVAVDKSLIAGRGRRWSARDRRRHHRPRGVDADTSWAYSKYDGWVQGYAYEVVVTAEKKGVSWPLLASAHPAAGSEQKSFLAALPALPARTRFVLADAGYDSNALGEAVEWQPRGCRSGRRFLCPEVPRPNVGRPRRSGSRETRARQFHRRLRDQRRRYFQSPAGRRWYARRKISVEPFHSHFKHLFELEERTWLWGLANNQTLLLAALWGYQLLLTYQHRRRCHNACLQTLLDAL